MQIEIFSETVSLGQWVGGIWQVVGPQDQTQIYATSVSTTKEETQAEASNWIRANYPDAEIIRAN